MLQPRLAARLRDLVESLADLLAGLSDEAAFTTPS